MRPEIKKKNYERETTPLKHIWKATRLYIPKTETPCSGVYFMLPYYQLVKQNLVKMLSENLVCLKSLETKI